MPPILALTAPACGSSTGPATTACSPIVVEQIDPNEGHLIPGAPEPSYVTDPPTSGPHIGGLVLVGVRSTPLSGIEQVSTLEAGGVIVQYDPDEIDDAGRRSIEHLAGRRLTVAPAPDLPGAVVATGWLRKMTCTSVDVVALRGFADTVTDRHEGHPKTSGA